MTHSVRLPVTPPINQPNNSPQHSSSTFTISSDCALLRPATTSCGTWLGHSQVPRQHITDHPSPTSSGPRSLALSNENSDDETSLRNGSIENSVIGTMEDSISSSCEKFGSARGYSRITKLPRPSRNFRSGKLLNKFHNHPKLGSKTVIELPTSANILKLWKWEVLNCVLAIGMLGSMYGVLLHYDSLRIPDWGSTINLSTLIALMATLLRTMLVFVVSEIIGQAKWKYFAGNAQLKDDPPMRRLIQTSRFNDASQGSLSAIKLLPTIIRDPVTSLAVLVMTMSLGTGSFVQQAIQTQSCQLPADSAHASLPVSRNITTSKAGEAGISGTLDYSKLIAAFSSALAPDSEEIGSPISVGCPTGNCTFQNSIGGVYSTLGVCSLCADTSSLITTTEWKPKCNPDDVLCITSTANYTLPNGMSVQSSFGSTSYPHLQDTEVLVSPGLGLDWAGDLASPDMKALSKWAFANVTILTPNWLPTDTGYAEYAAATCTLYSCLRSYTGSVTSGKLDEVLVSTVPAVPDVGDMYFPPGMTTEAVQEKISGSDSELYAYGPDPHFFAVQSPCLVNNTIWTKENRSSSPNLRRLVLAHADPDPSGALRVRIENTTAPAECIYDLDTFAVLSGFSKAADIFNGSCGISGLRISSHKNGTTIDCGEKYWLASLFAEKGLKAASTIQRIEDFTDRLSNKMRMGLLNNPDGVSGQVLQAAVCSRIHYSWLAFPAVLLAMTSGLLAWTMFRSSRRRGREMVWKSSILPFLFYGDRFVVQNGEDVSASSAESSRRDEAEPLLDLDRMETEARQRVVRFNALE